MNIHYNFWATNSYDLDVMTDWTKWDQICSIVGHWCRQSGDKIIQHVEFNDCNHLPSDPATARHSH